MVVIVVVGLPAIALTRLKAVDRRTMYEVVDYHGRGRAEKETGLRMSGSSSLGVGSVYVYTVGRSVPQVIH